MLCRQVSGRGGGADLMGCGGGGGGGSLCSLPSGGAERGGAEVEPLICSHNFTMCSAPTASGAAGVPAGVLHVVKNRGGEQMCLPVPHRLFVILIALLCV